MSWLSAQRSYTQRLWHLPQRLGDSAAHPTAWRCCDPPRLVAREQLSSGAPAGVILEIDLGERLYPVASLMQKLSDQPPCLRVQVLIGLIPAGLKMLRSRTTFICLFERNYRNADEALGNDARQLGNEGILPELSRFFYKSELEMPMYLI